MHLATAIERGGNNCKGFKELHLECPDNFYIFVFRKDAYLQDLSTWFEPGPESGLGYLKCAELPGQRRVASCVQLLTSLSRSEQSLPLAAVQLIDGRASPEQDTAAMSSSGETTGYEPLERETTGDEPLERER